MRAGSRIVDQGAWRLWAAMRALVLVLLALARADAANKLSTWVSPGAGGPMGNDLTEALAWVTVSSFTPAGAPAPRCRH